MIPQAAIDKFIERPRNDYRTYKDLSPKQLDKLEAKLPQPIPFWEKLRLHQKVCSIIGAKNPRCAMWLDTGCGKTLLSIVLIRYLRRTGALKHALVLVPRRVNKSEWAREIKKHSPKTSFRVLKGSSAQKWEQLMQEPRPLITIETYPGLMRMVCDMVALKRRRKKKKSRLKPNLKKVKLLQKLFQGMILDESTSLKSHDSLPFRVCKKMSQTCPAVFALSGTPFGRDPGDLWAQMRVVDGGYALGENLGLFRSVFFSTSVNFWGGYEHTFLKRKTKLLHRMLAHSSIRYEADQADLPRVTKVVKAVNLGTDANSYYQKAKDMIRASRGNYLETKNAFLRMRQISSGFVGFKDDESGDTVQFEFPNNPKLDLLMGICESLDRKAIVFHDFIWSGKQIAKGLKELKIDFAQLNGSTKNDKIMAKELHRFDHDPDCRILVLSNALAIGLNLQTAAYGIFFEAPVSVITRVQACRRFERQESPHRHVFRYDLVVRGTVDQQILAFHKQGKDLFKAIVDGKIDPL